MTTFDLHERVWGDYRDFVRSSIRIEAERARAFGKQALAEQSQLWPERLVRLSPAHALGATVDEPARQGVIEQQTPGFLVTPEQWEKEAGRLHSPFAIRPAPVPVG